MAYIKNYQRFVEEFVMAGSPRPGTIETPVETPTTPALPIPTEIPDEQDNPLAGTKTGPRPVETPVETPVTPALPIPTEVPDEQDNPLASAEDVIDRLSDVYSKEDKKGKSEIDSYFY